MRPLACIALLAACATERAPAVPIDKPPEESGALVLVIDRSGSMQGPKLDAAKEAAVATVESLDEADQIAIVTFSSEPEIAVPLTPSTRRAEIGQGVASISSGGGTALLPALEAAARILSRATAQHRHVIVLSDGELPSDGLFELAREMKSHRITLSTVAVAGADEDLLQRLSAEGGGRAYSIDDLAMLKSTFVQDSRIALNAAPRH